MLGKSCLIGMLAVAAVTASADNKVTIGRLGQTIDSVKITSKQGGGRTYYTCKPYEYLVLTSTAKGYYQVLLQNGAKGWIASKQVATLPYDVKKDAVSQRSGGRPSMALLSRGGGRTSSSAEGRAKAADLGTQYQGTRYKWGGNDIINGIDCSAFVQQLMGHIGLKLPRTAAQQALVGTPINRLEDLRKGDRLYFWSSKRNMIGHTGIYLGNGYFVHSSSNNGGVSTDYLGSKTWMNILVAARR